ncbi:MAG: cytochrome ubiquinol oxidase subunit I [Acidimicrobiales bacterium]|nr:cytochrome ubiquinol oxidase subunit I [Acidimicrobiales bacterium]
MSTLDLARLQFASTSIFHFLFVPVTIGLSFLVALLQTAWHRGGDEAHLRLTRFFGTLLVINIAVGVVTGLVQEFQFGMDWASYSRFVGDVFGAPLAMEGLAAFFLESTFLGLWLFGWNRLSKRVHLACIWAVAIGAALSAYFIMAANSWMQRPVGYSLDQAADKARLTDIWAVLTSSFQLWAYAHVILASLVTGSMVMLAVSAWHLRRRSDPELYARSAALSLWVLLPSALLAAVVGSGLGVVLGTYQPMKIAAAEALWNTEQPASFTLFQVGGWSPSDPDPSFDIEIPHLLSILATNSWDGEVVGLNQLQAQYEQEYGPGDYIPNVFVSFWAMRAMAYLATVAAALAAWGLWLLHRRTLAAARWFPRIAVAAVALPFLMNTAGWVLTEVGRQPWIVYGLQQTTDAVSPTLTTFQIALSLGVFFALYAVLAVLEAVLLTRYARRGAPEVPHDESTGAPVPAMSY